MKNLLRLSTLATLALILSMQPIPVEGSSHMDAPLITLDDPANTTDVYAFRSQSGNTQYLTTALAVYPFEEPGIGPNNYRFDKNVLYEIHIALGEDIDKGRKTISYQFEFETSFKNPNTTLQAFLGVIDCTDLEDGFPKNQNLRQMYKVTKVDRRKKGDDDDDDDNDDNDRRRRKLGTGRVPPNNQGLVTPQYNTTGAGIAGEGVARGGVASEAALDECTLFGITELDYGYRSFAGQRDDGFYADIQSIFDLDFTFGQGEFGGQLLAGTGKPFDSQGGFNLHTIVLNIPLSELKGATRAGVYATTSRRQVTLLTKKPEKRSDRNIGRFIQVARQGNPLFNEALIPVRAKDLYNRTDPTRDDALFRVFAENPELGSNDVSGIFIPDLIRVDLTTGPARLAGQTRFDRLGIFGPSGNDPDKGDLLQSQFQDPFNNGGFISGGFPNGRRFGDDVLDIAFIALGIANFDGVDANDITFNAVFPYAATPLNGRIHEHH